MDLRLKLNSESTEQPLIRLHLEGMFWKAYEQSALRFIKEIKAYKVLKKPVKSLGCEVAALGFPSGKLDEVLNGREYTRINEKEITLSSQTVFTREEFNEWKKSLPLQTDGVVPKSRSPNVDTGFSTFSSESVRQVIERLFSFSVETASPIQCMMLVSELQTLLK
ncbi:MAG: hypothetical protein LIP00_03555 [Parabacteroides sp.]|nr:hypothetical protein [Parabacteroides sp.]